MPKINRYRHLAIHATLVSEPGLTRGEIAQRLEVDYKSVDNALAGMERTRLLLWEDDDGKLYPYQRGMQ